MRQGEWHPKLLHHAAIVVAFTIAVFSIHDYPKSEYADRQANRPLVLAATSAPIASPTPSPIPSAAPSSKPSVPRSPKQVSTTARTNQFGIAAGSSLTSLSSVQLAQRLDGMKALGIGWVRYDIEWSNVETAPGQYNWSAYDQIVRAVSSRGLQSLAIIDYTPTWARRSECANTPMCAPADPGAYGRFAAAAAARYTPLGIRYWEIWNEPNNANFFQPGANASAYTALLRSAYPAIKRINHSATIVTGGTSPADTGGGYLSPPDFIRGIYTNGARGYFDAVAHHPYSYPFTPSNVHPGSAWSQLTEIHNIMAANGDGAKKIWATEYGAPTNGPGPTAVPGQWPLQGGWQVNEALQAIMLTDAISRYRSYSWAGPFFWYSYQDAGTSRSTVENFFGLLRYDGTRKPAYDAFIKAIR